MEGYMFGLGSFLSEMVAIHLNCRKKVLFIRKNAVPLDHQWYVTYGRIVVDIRPHKQEKERTRLTVGGDKINYPGETSTATSDLTTAKMVINSTISTPGARYCCLDVKKIYLGTPMSRYEYMRLPIGVVPDEIIERTDCPIHSVTGSHSSYETLQGTMQQRHSCALHQA